MPVSATKWALRIPLSLLGARPAQQLGKVWVESADEAPRNAAKTMSQNEIILAGRPRYSAALHSTNPYTPSTPSRVARAAIIGGESERGREERGSAAGGGLQSRETRALDSPAALGGRDTK